MPAGNLHRTHRAPPAGSDHVSWLQYAAKLSSVSHQPDISIAVGANAMAVDETVSQPVEIMASRHPGADEQDAYERVLSDAMDGDATLFAREDYVEEAWRIVDPVLKAATAVHEYEQGRGDRALLTRPSCLPAVGLRPVRRGKGTCWWAASVRLSHFERGATAEECGQAVDHDITGDRCQVGAHPTFGLEPLANPL